MKGVDHIRLLVEYMCMYDKSIRHKKRLDACWHHRVLKQAHHIAQELNTENLLEIPGGTIANRVFMCGAAFCDQYNDDPTPCEHCDFCIVEKEFENEVLNVLYEARTKTRMETLLREADVRYKPLRTASPPSRRESKRLRDNYEKSRRTLIHRVLPRALWKFYLGCQREELLPVEFLLLDDRIPNIRGSKEAYDVLLSIESLHLRIDKKNICRGCERTKKKGKHFVPCTDCKRVWFCSARCRDNHLSGGGWQCHMVECELLR